MQLARIVDILDHTHVLSRSLFPFSLSLSLSLSLFFSQEKQLKYLSSARSETGERICIPGLAVTLLLHLLETRSSFVRHVSSTQPTLLRARLHSHVHHISRGRL